MKCKNFVTIFLLAVLFATIFIVINSENSKAADTFAENLAKAILVDDSLLVSKSAGYKDNDLTSNRQAIICSSPMGILSATRGTSNFIILSTGIAGNVPVKLPHRLGGHLRKGPLELSQAAFPPVE